MVVVEGRLFGGACETGRGSAGGVLWVAGPARRGAGEVVCVGSWRSAGGGAFRWPGAGSRASRRKASMSGRVQCRGAGNLPRFDHRKSLVDRVWEGWVKGSGWLLVGVGCWGHWLVW